MVLILGWDRQWEIRSIIVPRVFFILGQFWTYSWSPYFQYLFSIFWIYLRPSLLLIHLGQQLFHWRIPMILYWVVCPPLQIFCYLGPSVAQKLMREEQHPFFMLSPLFLLDVRIEMIMPSLPALFANPSLVMSIIPGRFSAIVVHFCGPNLCTSLTRY